MGFTNETNSPVNNNTSKQCAPQQEGIVNVQNVESNEEEPPEGMLKTVVITQIIIFKY